MRIVVTGSLGFIFSNFVRQVQCIAGIDKAVKKYNLDNLYVEGAFEPFLADICDAHTLDNIFSLEQPELVIHGAAESFVDDAIANAGPFMATNVVGTQNVIDACLKYGARLIHISTDEVYGHHTSRNATPWTEDQPISPRNPYAASKGAAEFLVRSAGLTHGLNYNITRSCNVYGPRQKKENLIPHVIHGLIERKPIRIHGNGENFRQYIFVNDVISGIMTVVNHGKPGEVYNIGDDNLYSNLEIVDVLAKQLGRKATILHVQDRKGHDFGYHIDSTKLRALGWEPGFLWETGIRMTVEHYLRHNGQAYAT